MLYIVRVSIIVLVEFIGILLEYRFLVFPAGLLIIVLVVCLYFRIL